MADTPASRSPGHPHPAGSSPGPAEGGAAPSGAEPSGAEPSGAEPNGAEPSGAEPSGAEPSGAEPSDVAPSDVAPSDAPPSGVAPSGAVPLDATGGGASPRGAAPETSAAFRAEGGAGALARRMGILVLEASAARVVATMPVDGNTQPYGLLHGGATVVLAETLGSIAASLHAGPGRGAVGIEVNATHHRGVRSGLVTGVATALHLGGRTASYEIAVTDEADRRVATARLTCVVLDAVRVERPAG